MGRCLRTQAWEGFVVSASRTAGVLVVVALLAACGENGAGSPAAGGAGDGEAIAIEVVARDDAPMGHADTDLDHDEAAPDHDTDVDRDEAEPNHDADADHDEAEPGRDADVDHDAVEPDRDADADHDAEAGDDADAGHESDADHGSDTDDVDHEAEATDTFVVNVEMVEFGYVADQTVLPVGEDVIFRFVNTGAIAHEAMFGSSHEQAEFAESGDHGGGGHDDAAGHHGEVTAITLDAGASADLVLRFETSGELWIGCHLPGHWDSGMGATFQVA